MENNVYEAFMNALMEDEDTATEAVNTAPVTEEVEVDPEDILTSGMESMVFLDVLKETCTKDEFSSFLKENKTELEVYGLVDGAAIAKESYDGSEEETEEEAATEAKNIVRLNRDANIAREEARIAIGLAKKSNDQLYTYYKKYSDLKRKFRDKIYAKYGTRARPLARQAVMNSRNKATAMNSKTGTTIINKIDSRIKALDENGRNKTAVAR